MTQLSLPLINNNNTTTIPLLRWRHRQEHDAQLAVYSLFDIGEDEEGEEETRPS